MAFQPVNGLRPSLNRENIQIPPKANGQPNVAQLVKKILSIDINQWQHGSPLNKISAETLLRDSPKETWLLRYSAKARQYVISQKLGNNYYRHDKNLNKLDVSVDNLIKGFSSQYKFSTILLNDQVLKENKYNYNSLMEQQAIEELKISPNETWLMRYNTASKVHVLTIKTETALVDFSINTEQENKIYTLQQQFHRNSQELIHSKFNFSYHLGIRNPGFRTPLQCEFLVNFLFNKEMACEDSLVRKDFVRFGMAKISRVVHRELSDSYIVIREEHFSGREKLVRNSSPHLCIKALLVIHGEHGFLGEGKIKVAKLLNHPQTNGNIVLSKFKKFNAKQVEKEYPELPNILRIVSNIPYVAAGIFTEMSNVKTKETYSYIISEYADSDLEKEIEMNLDVNTKKKYALQLLMALSEVHKKGIAHRDIKPANINIVQGNACLADWDFATMAENPSMRGTPLYLAPEIVNEQCICNEDLRRGDVYALGMTLYELFNKKHLWLNPIWTYKQSLAYFYDFIAMKEDQFLAWYPKPPVDTIDHLLWEMLQLNPYKRPTAYEAKEKLTALLKA
jgi:Protein kinase domain